MAAARSEVLSLYKSLLREGSQFSNYNFRKYTLKRVKDSFKDLKSETNPQTIQEHIAFGRKNLDIIKRQVVIGSLYKTDNLVIEKKDN